METVIAIDVGGTKIAGALVHYGEGGEPPTVGARAGVPTDAREGGAAVLGRIVELAGRLLGEASNPSGEGEGLPAGAVVGIGVGTAGVVNPIDGSIAHAVDLLPGYAGQPVGAAVSERIGLPTAVLGDVQAHALGEARWGSARGAQSSICAGVGTGLGGAYVVGDQVMRGFHGAAGHFGHSLHPTAAGVRCSCGQSAHVESVVSGTAIAAAYQGKDWLDELDRTLMGDVVAARANEGELEAIAVIEAAGFALGEAIGSWCNMLDPEVVVLSGSVASAGPLWRAALDRGFKSQALPPLADIPILNAALGDDAPLIGAAEFLRDSR